MTDGTEGKVTSHAEVSTSFPPVEGKEVSSRPKTAKPSWVKPNPRRLDADLCRCGLLVLKGLDDDVAGLPVQADPLALSPAGEVVALRDGRTTYTLEGSRLYSRDKHRMRTFRHNDWAVHAAHRCNSPMPQQCARTLITPPKAIKEIPNEPAF